MSRPDLRRLASVVAIGLTIVGVAHAAPALDGKWHGETDGGASILLDLTVKGTALTGTLTRDGQSTTLSDGKVSDSTFTFKATINSRTDGFSGKLDGDSLKLWLDRQGESKAIVLTRVKDKRRPSTP